MHSMAVNIIVDPPKSVRPEGAIRCDVAWKLYLPEYMGELPAYGGAELVGFNNWLWNELGHRIGYIKKDNPENVWILTPPLTEAALSYVVRICSIWSDDVFVIRNEKGKVDLEAKGENRWTAPICNVKAEYPDDPAFERFTSCGHKAGETEMSVSPLLGATRSFMRIYNIPQGGTYARLHSHTAREETYIVLKGKGTVRYGGHSAEISEGDLISKPLGPDVPSQLLADRGEPLRILDIEIWPDRSREAKDVVHYPDHGELDLFGPGWNIMIPDSVAYPSEEDAMKNYSSGYFRNADGTWEPKDIPGFRTRERTS